ncbi:MAG: aminoglycoside phosphotransferase family protein [Candidatus Heimdallarchaeaceae archaeon]|jgi:hygromycin-B 4-O-kinase
MSTAKTQIDPKLVKTFLDKKFDFKVDNLEFLRGGEFSQAFSYDTRGQSHVIKIRNTRKQFEKELMAYESIEEKDNTIPIPRIFDIGLFRENANDRLFYCISEKVEGKILTDYRYSELKIIDPFLIRMLIKIHRVDISDTKNFGKWTKFEQTSYKSWKNYILDFMNGQKVYWNKIFSNGIFEKELHQTLSKEIEELLEYSSEKRHLVHGDYGYDNVLATPQGKITGVIDWEHSMFGDFVYDIAWLDFWGFVQENNYWKIYKRIYEKIYDDKIVNYDERLRCYRLYIGLGALAFFSDSSQKKSYLSAKERVEKLI